MNILLSSVGRRSYLVEYFKEALRGKGLVIATNTVAETTGMFSADVAEVVPPAKDNGFIDALLDICRRHDVQLLCSLHDWEAPYIARNKSRFLAEGVIPVVPEPHIVDMCLDKYQTAVFSEALGVPFPKCFIKVDAAVKALDSGELEYPLLLKPRWGQGSIAMRKVHSRDELEPAYALIHAQLNDDGLSYLAGSEQNRQVLIQQFVKGQEYGVDMVNDLNGNFAACFVKHKFAMRSGETDAAETVCVPKIKEFGSRIAKATKHPGNMDADFFISADKQVYLLELNPRFGGGYPFSHMAGANIPAALVAWAEGLQPDPSDLVCEIGVKGYKDIRIVSPRILR